MEDLGRDVAPGRVGSEREARVVARPLQRPPGEAERVVRSTLAQASEFAETGWSPDVELADEPLPRCWQLAGIAPLGDLDRLTLLRSASTEELLRTTVELTRDAAVQFSAPWPDDEA